MGLRDAAALADVVEKTRAVGLDLGGVDLETYGAWRNFDNQTLATSTDVLNKAFSNKILPLRHARRIGLSLVNRSDRAKVFFMKEAAGYMGDLPSLLQE